MSKYYRPEIEEFHVGFEYERFVPRKNATEEECWEKIEMSINFLSLDDIDDEIIEKEIRVKYLDKGDILSFSFTDKKHAPLDWYKLEKRTEDGWSTYGHWNKFRLLHDYTLHRVKIIAYEFSYEEEESVLFQGSCRNKSELKRILTQIGL